jgi:hypothetical protein
LVLILVVAYEDDKPPPAALEWDRAFRCAPHRDHRRRPIRLAAAIRLGIRGHRVVVLEAGSDIGGCCSTQDVDGFRPM